MCINLQNDNLVEGDVANLLIPAVVDTSEAMVESGVADDAVDGPSERSPLELRLQNNGRIWELVNLESPLPPIIIIWHHLHIRDPLEVSEYYQKSMSVPIIQN
jgi:hypothetical protein